MGNLESQLGPTYPVKGATLTFFSTIFSPLIADNWGGAVASRSPGSTVGPALGPHLPNPICLLPRPAGQRKRARKRTSAAPFPCKGRNCRDNTRRRRSRLLTPTSDPPANKYKPRWGPLKELLRKHLQTRPILGASRYERRWEVVGIEART